MNSFAMSVLAVVALRPKMDAEETSVVRLYRYAEQEASEGRPVHARRVAVHFILVSGSSRCWYAARLAHMRQRDRW